MAVCLTPRTLLCYMTLHELISPFLFSGRTSGGDSLDLRHPERHRRHSGVVSTLLPTGPARGAGSGRRRRPARPQSLVSRKRDETGWEGTA